MCDDSSPILDLEKSLAGLPADEIGASALKLCFLCSRCTRTNIGILRSRATVPIWSGFVAAVSYTTATRYLSHHVQLAYNEKR